MCALMRGHARARMHAHAPGPRVKSRKAGLAEVTSLSIVRRSKKAANVADKGRNWDTHTHTHTHFCTRPNEANSCEERSRALKCRFPHLCFLCSCTTDSQTPLSSLDKRLVRLESKLICFFPPQVRRKDVTIK